MEVSVSEISQAVQLLTSQVTLWGTPADSRHEQARGWECLGRGRGTGRRAPNAPQNPKKPKKQGTPNPPPYLILPATPAARR